MAQKIELKKEDLAQKLASDQNTLMRKIIKANRKLADRAKHLGFTIELDRDEDVLTITIGDGGGDLYTQGFDHMFADMDMDTDEIVSFTILEFEGAFLKSEAGKKLFSENILLPVLTKYGVVSFPPELEGTRLAASELRTLVPA